MKKTISFLMALIMLSGILVLSPVSVTIQASQALREELNMNDSWGFYRGDLLGAHEMDFDDSDFANITIPHTMRLEKKHAGNASSVYQGIGWYRRYFTLDESYNDKKVFLDFEGVMIDSDIYLNGEKIHTRNGGYIGFNLDISDKVKIGEKNLLALRVSSENSPNTPPGKNLANLDFHYYGGIYRNVKMIVTDKVYITNALSEEKVASGGIFVSYDSVTAKEAIVNVKTHIANDYSEEKDIKINSSIVDSNDEIVSQGFELVNIAANSDVEEIQKLTVTNPKLWHPDKPNLYTLVSEISINGVIIDTVRTKMGIRYLEMKPDGFYINGERLYLRGANRHQSYAFVGDAAPDSMQYRDAIQMKENGFNSVRATHYPQAPAFLDACDELGILVIECQPGWQNFTNSQEFYDLTIRDTREMIRRDRNRPSVFLWEASLNETGFSRTWAIEATNAAHEEMPGNQMFTASDYGYHGDLYEVNYKIIDNGNDQNPNKAVFTREWGDWAGWDQARRSNGEARQIAQVNRHEIFLNGDGYPDWGGLDEADRMGGYFLWSWNDYARGSEQHTLPSGTVEIDRHQKFLFYWLKSMTDARNPAYEPMVYIASDYMKTSSKNIQVYSNCDSVKLYQNNILIKELTREELADSVQNISKKGGSPIFKFSLPEFIEGELRAEGYLDGKLITSHTVKTPKMPKSIKIEADLRGIMPIADGSDLIPVYFKIVDENGTIVPNYTGEITIDVLGEGKLVGKGITRIAVEEQTPESGIGYAFIRTTHVAGDIQIIAKADSTSTAIETITTAPYNENFVLEAEHTLWEGGVEKLETKIEYQNVALKKTATASTVQTQNPIQNAFDDSEGTRWCASGGEYPQWIKVDLGVSMDLIGFNVNWENHSAIYGYSIEVSEDDLTWNTVLDMSGNTAVNKDELQMVKSQGRYVRLNILSATTGWASIWEFGVLAPLGDLPENLPGEIITNDQISSITASCESAPNRGTDKLRDGDTLIGTGWLAATEEFPQSVTVKFKKPVNLNGSRIYWEKDSSWYTYDLEVSTDGNTWEKVLDDMYVGGQYFKPEKFSEIYRNTNYARITIKNIIGGQARIGMAELIFYGDNTPIKSFDYLSDLDWTSAHSDYTSVEKDGAVYSNLSIGLNLDGVKKEFSKGISSDTDSEIIYELSNEYSKFEAYLGISTTATKNGGEAIFKIYADDELIYTSPVKMRNDNCEFVSLDIIGVEVLRLTAQWSRNTENIEARYNTHVVWADAKLIYKAEETFTANAELTLEGDSMIARFESSNDTAKEREIICMVATYDEYNKMVSLKVQQIKLPAFSGEASIDSLTIPIEEHYKAKAFIWDLYDMKPVIEPVEF